MPDIEVTLKGTTMPDGRTIAFIPPEYQFVDIDGQQAVVSNPHVQRAQEKI